MALGDFFEQTAAAFPNSLNWTLPFDWRQNVPQLIQSLQQYQTYLIDDDEEAMLRFSEAVRSDLINQTAIQTEESAAAQIDCVRFVVANLPMRRTLANGLFGDCYNWVLWGIARDHDPNTRINTADYKLPPYDGAPHHLNTSILPFLVDWVTDAYLLARKFGGLDAHCTDFFAHSFRAASIATVTGEFDVGVTALIAMVNWAAPRRHPGAETLAGFLLALLSKPEVPSRTQAQIRMLFLTVAAQWTDQSPNQWARTILDAHRADLLEHELLQVLAVSTDSLEAWNENRTEILVETRRLAGSYSANRSALDARIVLESRVPIIHPLIFCLTKYGSTEDVLDLLWAWYGSEGRSRADANVLFVAPSHGEGVAYLWQNGRWFGQAETLGESLETLLAGISNALNDYFRGPAGDRSVAFDERMAGAPAFEEAERLLGAMKSHYQLDGLAEVLPQNFVPRSIIVFPAQRDPLQSLISQRLNWFAPLEASLALGHADRPIGVISVWPGETQLTEPEVETIVAAATSVGWTVKVQSGTLDSTAFRSFYEDEEADVLWVIGHGEQSPYRINETGLIMDNHVLLPVTEISQYAVPKTGRRLLVLNVCSSGSAQNMDGMARIGLAQELASPNQHVVAHLWPIDYYAALAFGCAFISRLRTHDVSSAFSSAVEIMRDQNVLIDELSQLSPGLSAIDRLSPEWVVPHLDNVLSWGCPALMS